MAKSHKRSFESNLKSAANPLDLVHCDLWGPSPITSKDDYRYYVSFVDDHSRFTWFYPFKTKTRFYEVLKSFIKLVQTQFSRKIKVFQSDGGSEFVNHHVKAIFDENGTFHRLSCPYTPQQNGRAERKHRHIVETGLALLFNAKVPTTYWVDAFSSATFIINRLPTQTTNGMSPFEVLFDCKPNYNNFRTFGCRVFPYLRDYAENKLATRSLPCIFLGYSTQHKGYKCLDTSSNRLYITRHARFDENLFLFSGAADTNNYYSLFLTMFDADTVNVKTTYEQQPPPKSTPSTIANNPNGCGLCDDEKQVQHEHQAESAVQQTKTDSSTSESDISPDDLDSPAIATSSEQQALKQIRPHLNNLKFSSVLVLDLIHNILFQ